MQHPLTSAVGKHIPISASVHNDLLTFDTLLAELVAQPTHLLNLLTYPTTCSGDTDTSGSGMSDICRNPTVKWYIFRD